VCHSSAEAKCANRRCTAQV